MRVNDTKKQMEPRNSIEMDVYDTEEGKYNNISLRFFFSFIQSKLYKIYGV